MACLHKADDSSKLSLQFFICLHTILQTTLLIVHAWAPYSITYLYFNFHIVKIVMTATKSRRLATATLQTAAIMGTTPGSSSCTVQSPVHIAVYIASININWQCFCIHSIIQMKYCSYVKLDWRSRFLYQQSWSPYSDTHPDLIPSQGTKSECCQFRGEQLNWESM